MGASKTGSRLRYLRQSARVRDATLTLDRVSAEIGFTRGYLMHIEKGKAMPSPAQLSKMLEVYGVEDEIRASVTSTYLDERGSVRKDEVSPAQWGAIKDVVMED